MIPFRLPPPRSAFTGQRRRSAEPPQRRSVESGPCQFVRVTERIRIETVEAIGESFLCRRFLFAEAVRQVASNFRSTNGRMPPERN